MGSSFVADVDEHEFDERVVAGSRAVPVVVDYWAGWCRPCLVLSPVLERLAVEHEGRFLLAKVDVDANPRLAGRFGIQGIPAVKAFRDGRVVSEFVGAQPETVVRRFLEELLPSEADDLASSGVASEERGDLEAAEGAYRTSLDRQPDHPVAAVGLARLLMARGDIEEARGVLARVPPGADARQLLAELELRELAGSGDGLAGAAAAAVSGDPRTALERGLALVSDSGDDRESARDLVVRIFEVLGDDHALTREFRPRLARALF